MTAGILLLPLPSGRLDIQDQAWQNAIAICRKLRITTAHACMGLADLPPVSVPQALIAKTYLAGRNCQKC